MRSYFCIVFFSSCLLEAFDAYSFSGEGLADCCYYAYAKQPGIEGQGWLFFLPEATVPAPWIIKKNKLAAIKYLPGDVYTLLYKALWHFLDEKQEMQCEGQGFCLMQELPL